MNTLNNLYNHLDTLSSRTISKNERATEVDKVKELVQDIVIEN